MRKKPDAALEAAVSAVLKLNLTSREPDQDPRLLIIKQLHEMNRKALERAQYLEFCANQSKLAAMAAFEETKVRGELLMEELGLLPEEDEEENDESI